MSFGLCMFVIGIALMLTGNVLVGIGVAAAAALLFGEPPR